MDGADPSAAPWWAAGGAFALWATREIWGVVASRRKERTETDANIDLLNGLVARVKSLEESQGAITAQLNQEIDLRRAAQEEAHRLRLRVMTLEATLRGMGAVIPPEVPTL